MELHDTNWRIIGADAVTELKSGDVRTTARIPLAVKAKLFAVIGRNMNNLNGEMYNKKRSSFSGKTMYPDI